MGDRSGTSSRVRTSEDKVRRKDLCWSVRVCLCPIKMPDSQWTDHVNDPLEILGGHATKNQNSVRFVLVIKKGKSFFKS